MKEGFLGYIIELGVKPNMSIVEARRIRFGNLLCFVSSVMSFAASAMYFVLEIYFFGSLILIMAFYFMAGIYFTRLGYNKLSRNTIFFITNLFLTFGASIMGRESGVVLVYFPLIFYTIFCFEGNEKLSLYFFLVLYFSSIQLLEITDYKLFDSIYVLPGNSKDLFPLHLNIAFLTTVFGTIYIFKYYRKSEEVLEKSENTLQAIYNNSTDAIFIVNSNSLIIEECNQQAMVIFEVEEKSDLVDSRCTYLLKNGYTKDEMLDIAGKARTNPSWSQEIELVTRKGKIFWGNISVKVFTIEKREVLHIRITDITARKIADEKLKSLNNELETFMYKSSHNLKGPSASILGLINIAKRDITDANSLKFLEMIEQNSKRLDSTLVDLLNITRIKQGGITPTLINARELINGILESMQYYPGIDKMKIKTFIDPMDDLTSDKILISGIIHNLLENSIKYRDTEKESFVSISFTEIAQNIRIEVTDNGVGIPEIFHDKVFNMFFRADDNSEGAGLGLYIVKNSVDKLNGRIVMESIEGRGTTFIISFPKA